MDPIVLTALVTAVGSQLVSVIKAAKGQKAIADTIGEQNGLGTVHQALTSIDKKLEQQCAALQRLDARVSAIESK